MMTPEDRVAVDEMLRTNEVSAIARKAIVLDVIELGIRVQRAEREALVVKAILVGLILLHIALWIWG